MANLDMPVRIVTPEDEAAELSPTSSGVLVTMCDICYVLVPLAKLTVHVQAAHDI